MNRLINLTDAEIEHAFSQAEFMQELPSTIKLILLTQRRIMERLSNLEKQDE